MDLPEAPGPPTSPESRDPASASGLPPSGREERTLRAAPDKPAHNHLLVQAPVDPVDVDGLVFVTAGTVLFALASVALALYYPKLAQRGDGWWLGVVVAGFLLGLIGSAYCLNRRRRRRLGSWTRD